jgi:LEA14-like dessication related protein
MMRKVVLLATAATVIAASACASLGRSVFDEPVVTFKEVKLNGIGLTGGDLDVVLSVYNPNKFDLKATQLTYQLLVDTLPLGQGQLADRFVVPEKDSSTVRIPISFSYAGLGAAGRQLLQSGAVNYRVRGDVTVDTPIGNFKRPYDRTGKFTALSGATSR